MTNEVNNLTDASASEVTNNATEQKKTPKPAKQVTQSQPSLMERAIGYCRQLDKEIKREGKAGAGISRDAAIAETQESMRLMFAITVLGTFATVAKLFRQYHTRLKSEVENFDEGLFWKDDKIAQEIINRASSSIDTELNGTPKLTKEGTVKYKRDKVVSRLANIVAPLIQLGIRSEDIMLRLMLKMKLDSSADFAKALDTVVRGCELFRPVYSAVRYLKYAGLIVAKKEDKQQEFDLYRVIANRADIDGLTSQGAANALNDVVNTAYQFFTKEPSKILTPEQVAFVVEQVNAHNAGVRARIQKGEKKADIPSLLWENVKLAKSNAASAGTNA
jgi:hypothetical protein